MRLLAGTALSMLLNTAPQPESGARAALTLFQLMDRGECYAGSGKSLTKGTERGHGIHRQSEYCCCVHFRGAPRWMDSGVWVSVPFNAAISQQVQRS